jgi:hypothetical protein
MIITKQEFEQVVEDLVWKHDISYMDAIVLYCEENNIDVESLAKVIKANPNLKGLLQLEAEKLNYLPKTVTLDDHI